MIQSRLGLCVLGSPIVKKTTGGGAVGEMIKRKQVQPNSQSSVKLTYYPPMKCLPAVCA